MEENMGLDMYLRKMTHLSDEQKEKCCNKVLNEYIKEDIKIRNHLFFIDAKKINTDRSISRKMRDFIVDGNARTTVEESFINMEQLLKDKAGVCISQCESTGYGYEGDVRTFHFRHYDNINDPDSSRDITIKVSQDEIVNNYKIVLRNDYYMVNEEEIQYWRCAYDLNDIILNEVSGDNLDHKILTKKNITNIVTTIDDTIYRGFDCDELGKEYEFDMLSMARNTFNDLIDSTDFKNSIIVYHAWW
jgi:hypothetical protein